jgi:hypothetical protein
MRVAGGGLKENKVALVILISAPTNSVSTSVIGDEGNVESVFFKVNVRVIREVANPCRRSKSDAVRCLLRFGIRKAANMDLPFSKNILQRNILETEPIT